MTKLLFPDHAPRRCPECNRKTEEKDGGRFCSYCKSVWLAVMDPEKEFSEKRKEHGKIVNKTT